MQVLILQKLRQTKKAKALADEHHVEYEERHKKGDILNLSLMSSVKRR